MGVPWSQMVPKTKMTLKRERRQRHLAAPESKPDKRQPSKTVSHFKQSNQVLGSNKHKLEDMYESIRVSASPLEGK